ncbi:DUF6497 family protein [Alkalilacustris brevis]|uniref:DUF6497 family protein n=1 Tax=Alkalilacustris brevis TaxID=2026338 RepID=UPI0012D316E0|nr:DUF6497 family protein [Alkalilacustris brevis]
MQRWQIMRYVLVAVCAGLVGGSALPAAGQSVPSGQPVGLHEAILEPQPDGTHWLRLRFIAPRLGEDASQIGPEAAQDDMDYLCRTVGLPVAERSGREVSRVVISLSREEVDFGVAAPGVTQYFEAYLPAMDDCIWEEF